MNLGAVRMRNPAVAVMRIRDKPGRLLRMQVGQVLGGRYSLMEPLGSGGTAVVWHAHDEVLGRSVAVKLLADRHREDPESRQQIRDEARAAAALSHPNIAQVHDYRESDDGVPYVVMELIRGGTLQHRLAAGPLPPRYAMRVAAEVFAALAAAHADGLVHRDIKPGNVMVTPSGIKVVDFGIAAAISPGSSPEDAFEVLGTPAYVAPERLVDDAVEPASDVYSVGVLLYRMLTGGSPWEVDTTTQVLAAHKDTDPLPLPVIPGVPDYVTRLGDRCLSKDPTMRPSAREAATVLAQGAGLRVVEDEPAGPPAPATADSEPSVLIRREARAAAPADSGRGSKRSWLVGAAVAVVAAALLWLVLPSGRAGQPAAGQVPAEGRSAPVAVQPVASPAAGPSAPPAPTTPGPETGPGARRPKPAVPTTTTTKAPAPRVTTSPPASTKAPAPELRQRTFSLDVGSVTAVCTDPDTAELLTWSAIKPYKVKEVSAGPAAAPTILFKHQKDKILMTVTCSDGLPSSTTG